MIQALKEELCAGSSTRATRYTGFNAILAVCPVLRFWSFTLLTAHGIAVAVAADVRPSVDDDELRRVVPPSGLAREGGHRRRRASGALLAMRGKSGHEPELFPCPSPYSLAVCCLVLFHWRKTIWSSTQKLFGLMPSQVTGYGRLGVNRSWTGHRQTMSLGSKGDLNWVRSFIYVRRIYWRGNLNSL